MEGGHMLNKLHTKGTMKQQDQGSKRYKKRCPPMLSRDKKKKKKMQPVEGLPEI